MNKMSKFIVITSGKGGVGKTTTAINLASAMASFDHDVTLVDVNLTTPNVGLHLGAPVVPITLNHVLSGKADIVDSIYEHESGTKVIPASLSVNELKQLNEFDLIPFTNDLRKISDTVILDASAGLGSENECALKAADEVIIVTNPEMPAVTDALKAAKFAESLNKHVKGVIVTRVKNNKHEMSLRNIQEMLELPIIGVVPEDIKIQEALADRNSVFSNSPNSKSAKSYHKIAAKLLDIEIEEPKSVFSRILYNVGIRR